MEKEMFFDGFLSLLKPSVFWDGFLNGSVSSAEILVFILFAAIIFVFRYLIFSGLLYALTYFLPSGRKIQKAKSFTKTQISREILYSLSTMPIYLLVFFGILLMAKYGLNLAYMDIGKYGWGWFFLQMPIALLFWDFYFYWMHRFIHHKTLYKRFHKVHHLSTNPSPFSAIAFSQTEAVTEYIYFILLAMLLPMNFYALLIVSSFGFLYSAYGHLGYEIMPKFIAKNSVGRLINSACHHNQHHRTFKYNFGLYTVIWDRLFGTYHPEADSLVKEIQRSNLLTGSKSAV